jgi:microcin C transport system permease protein
MIERFIENELTLKRWRRFKKRKTAVWSCVFILFGLILTFSAPLIANSKPIMMKYEGNLYFPVFKRYLARDLGIEGSILVDYREIDFTDGNWALWPMIPWDPFESNSDVVSYPAPPSTVNLMGTDDRGRDVFTRLLYGFKYSFVYAFMVWLVCFILGTIAGGLMGFYGGKIDIVGQRIVEILSTVPQFFLLIILVAIFSPSLTLLIGISCLFGWIPISYYVRGEFLKNRKKEFVEAARSLGTTNFKLIFKHILPNSMAPIITFSPFAISSSIIALASLDYLGFGLEVPTPSWGELLAQAQRNYTIAWWLAVFPSIALFGTLTMLNLIGEGVRDAMDPNMN